MLSPNSAPSQFVDRIIDRMVALNVAISKDDKNLGRGFEVGHSYFCPTSAGSENLDWESWFRSVVEFEIAPLLREYWFDDLKKARSAIEGLLA